MSILTKIGFGNWIALALKLCSKSDDFFQIAINDKWQMSFKPDQLPQVLQELRLHFGEGGITLLMNLSLHFF